MDNIAHVDFETYSSAGYTFNGARYVPDNATPPYGLPAVGAPVYAEHFSTRALCMAYELPSPAIKRLWTPASSRPEELFEHVRNGGLIAAWNVPFERWIWNNVCVRLYGWPPLQIEQTVDIAAWARAFGIPGKLAHAAIATGATAKIEDGARLIKKFSVPRKPTKTDPRLQITLESEPEDAARMYRYCLGDVRTEKEIAAKVPPLSPFERRVWVADQRINERGVAIDMDGVRTCVGIVEEATKRYTEELVELTNGEVTSVGENKKFMEWLKFKGCEMPNMQAASVTEALQYLSPGPARRALEIRAVLGSASVKKLFAILRRVTRDGRLHDLLQFFGALMTGRWAGRGTQPQNLPSATIDDVDKALAVMLLGIDAVIRTYGDPIAAVAGCLRGLFIAGPGKDLICSDYSSIEAVVLAVLAGEEWRIRAFRDREDIYELSASMITGTPLAEFKAHREENNGAPHPLRKKVGKVAELASGFKGWIGAWKKFGAEKHVGDDETIKQSVIAWRQQSPAIVAFWDSLEKAAVMAIRNPGTAYAYRLISYMVKDDVLYCRLPSGRCLHYHSPEIQRTVRYGREIDTITFMSKGTHASEPWVRQDTWAGKLTENVAQAVANDILRFAIVNLEDAGYPIVLHVHDEIAMEVETGTGSIEEVERIMGIMPPWAEGWPIRAAGGWRGKRFRKG